MPMEAYERKYGRGPHVSVDTLVEWRGDLLLIRRGDGSWALPGGFVDPGEELLDAAIRELFEETSISLGADALRAAFLGPATVFSDPARDPRSHVITHVHHFVLPSDADMRVAAADDAKEARWVGDVSGFVFYADHRSIIESMWPR